MAGNGVSMKGSTCSGGSSARPSIESALNKRIERALREVIDAGAGREDRLEIREPAGEVVIEDRVFLLDPDEAVEREALAGLADPEADRVERRHAEERDGDAAQRELPESHLAHEREDDQDRYEHEPDRPRAVDEEQVARALQDEAARSSGPGRPLRRQYIAVSGMAIQPK